MRFPILLAAVLALAALPPAASAAPDEATTNNDVRCLFVSGALAQSDDPELKNIGTLSLFYFWGRLEGRGAPSDIVQRLIDASKRMSADDVKAQAQTCANLSKAAGQKISDISDALAKTLGDGAPPAAAPPVATAPGK
jgi:hypothetical protein